MTDGMVPPSPLLTRRLMLRLVTEQDVEPTAPLVTEDVAANLSTWPSPMSEQQVLERVRRSQDLVAARQAIDFAIVDRLSERLLGWIGMGMIEGGAARLGYWLGAPFRNRGIMKEAGAAVVPAAAWFLRVTRVKALVLKGNAASIAVLENLSFVADGEEIVLIETTGERASCLRYWRTIETK